MTNQKELGNLKKIDNLRKIWENEAADFTEWLSREENLSILSSEIGIDLSLLRTEAKVGSFSVDILAEEANTGEKVVIENQLEVTDHDHLGKIITYASGYDANIMIWIVKNERDEHKQAIDWLNDHTGSDLNFFIARLELWKVDNSLPAPKFQIISQPNDWAKALKEISRGTELTETKELQLDFWTKFKKYAQENTNELSLRKVRPRHWYNLSIGSSECHLTLTVNTRDNVLGCELYIKDNEELFDYLKENEEDIESKLNESLKWMKLPEKQASRIKLERNGDLEKEEKWEEYFRWFLKNSLNFKKVFPDYINEIT
ncbi:MAG: DUF4268 domain-containing protein [Candidatus Woesearchaeota archaeon]